MVPVESGKRTIVYDFIDKIYNSKIFKTKLCYVCKLCAWVKV